MLRKGSGKRWKGPIRKVGAATRSPFASKAVAQEVTMMRDHFTVSLGGGYSVLKEMSSLFDGGEEG